MSLEKCLMTFIHHYNITEYIHCPKNSLYSTYSYPPTPHSPITPWQPMILRTFFIRVGIMLVIETEVTEIGASIIFSVASSHWIQCRNNLPKTWILVCPYYKWLLCSKALFSLISIILYLGVVHLIISKANSFLNSSSYVRTYVRTEKVLSWQGIFFSLNPVLLF